MEFINEGFCLVLNKAPCHDKPLRPIRSIQPLFFGGAFGVVARDKTVVTNVNTRKPDFFSDFVAEKQNITGLDFVGVYLFAVSRHVFGIPRYGESVLTVAIDHKTGVVKRIGAAFADFIRRADKAYCQSGNGVACYGIAGVGADPRYNSGVRSGGFSHNGGGCC